MSQRQGGGGICTKNGSYCEKEKKVGEVGGGGFRVDVNTIFFFFFFFLGGGGLVEGGGGQGGCELRSESFVKIQKKKMGGGSGWGGRV